MAGDEEVAYARTASVEVQFPHHRRTIARMAERYAADPDVLALIIIGSVARGEAGAESDVDAYLVMSDAGYKRQTATGGATFDAADLCESPGNQAGGKVIDLAFLHDAVERAPEPTRFSFVQALVLSSRESTVAGLVRQIARYPERERVERMQDFVSELPVHLAYLEFAELSGNAYVLAQCAEQLVLFGGRLVLAHNRMLYPGRKWFLRQLERASDVPAGFPEMIVDLLRRPSLAAARTFHESVMKFADWPRPSEGEWARNIRNHELIWRCGPVTPAES